LVTVIEFAVTLEMTGSCCSGGGALLFLPAAKPGSGARISSNAHVKTTEIVNVLIPYSCNTISDKRKIFLVVTGVTGGNTSIRSVRQTGMLPI
jgi:hypothetical protein